MAIYFSSGTLSAPTKVLQVVSVPKTSHYNSATKNSWTTISGLTASITPTSSSSKILVMVMLSEGGSGNNYMRSYRVVRGSTPLNIGAALSGAFQAGFTSVIGAYGSSVYPCTTIPFTYLDSPSTTSSTTYSVQFFATSSSGIDTYVNRPYQAGNSNSTLGSAITLMEIGA